MSVAEMNEVEVGSPQYTMPKPIVGQQVLYYPSGRRSAEPQVAIVTRISVSGMNIALHVFGSRLNLGSVRHLDDPKLAQNQEMRADGAWDFLADHYEMARLSKQVEELKATNDSMAKQIIGLKTIIDSATTTKSGK